MNYKIKNHFQLSISVEAKFDQEIFLLNLVKITSIDFHSEAVVPRCSEKKGV